ncbi:hypothetical protein BT96DRAFT_976555 [Gymnopus androsaceus JB14]|uniref:Zinc finger C3HC4 RING-type domain-containing protein n=1 Tax=Gymnopus androsaceus JB14 TaxID=1447944 RepID=A0A6A4HKJ6_9AGAR|nr:hypothetical protein BT96DRAFT_976554 [Gymnopus androsaceus JB14]KAE9398221.1 hypothetical protein BT96DRAFT_976555 [Gymnopus androsaceus JB14]
MRFSAVFTVTALLFAGVAVALPMSDCADIEARTMHTSLTARTLTKEQAECKVCFDKMRDPKGMFTLCKNSKHATGGDPHAMCRDCMMKALESEGETCHVCREPLTLDHYVALMCPSPTPSPEPEQHS